MKKIYFLFAIFCICFSLNGYAADVYVSAAGNDTTGDGSSGNPYLTIGKAVTEATGGDTIIIVGTVSQTGQVDLGKNLTFQGQSDAVISGDGSNRLFNVSASSLTLSFSDILFQGMTSSDQGAVLNNTQTGISITITDCVFSGNTTSSTGGGGCIVMGGDGTATITNTTFYNNSATGTSLEARGGAIIVYTTATVNVTNCTFFGNTVPNRTGNFQGAAIRASTTGTTVTATNCLFYNNTTSNANADFNAVAGANMTLINSITQQTNNLDTNTNSNITADLTSSSLTWNGTLNSVTFSAPSVLTDDTPIDFGNDNSDVGSWDSQINLFNGSTDSDWATGANWSSTAAPTSSENATLLSDSPAAVVSGTTGAVCNDLSVDAGSSLTINSGGTIIVSGSSSGNITYNRSLGTSNWYLAGIPVAGETIEDMIANNSFATGTGSNIGFAPYDNAQAAAADRWDYQTAASTGSLTSGGGYSVKLASAGDLSFTGTVETADVGISITDGTGGGGNAFNLLGNPYSSFLAANTNADATNNLLSINTASLTENTLWFWDQSLGSYDQINLASSAFHVAPGQGFFISSTGSNTFNFTEAMQSHQGTDTFQRSTTNRPEIQLTLTDGTQTRDADIYFIENTTTGFDNGYDSSIFGGATHEFAIYTHAVGNGTGKNLGIQSLPNNNFEGLIIPVGVHAQSGSNITISAEAFQLPSGMDVYLEDKQDGSFTLLNGSSDFSTILSNDLSGIGRFYVHTSSEALSTDEIQLDNISIYTSGENNLRIVGIQNGNANVAVYTILGKQILTTNFTGNGVNDVALPNVRTGIYLVQLKTETGTLNKKVIIE